MEVRKIFLLGVNRVSVKPFSIDVDVLKLLFLDQKYFLMRLTRRDRPRDPQCDRLWYLKRVVQVKVIK